MALQPSTESIAAFFNEASDSTVVTTLAAMTPAELRDVLQAHDAQLALARILVALANEILP